MARLRRRKTRAKTLLDLRELVARWSAFAAQKTVVAYCEVKAGVNRDALFADERFVAALAICRWETFAVVLADALLSIESHLRPHLGERAGAFREHLKTMYAEAIGAEGMPAHRTGWDDAIEAFRLRIDQASLAAPRAPADIAAASVKVVFETLPVHAGDRRFDGEAIRGGVLFNFLALWEAVITGMDEAAIVAAARAT